MGRRGPKPKRADGFHITRAGYIRGKFGDRLRLVHNVIWESTFGAIPKGCCIHHRDGDRLNNAIENLVLLDFTAHKRVHGGCELRDGDQWWKPCKLCGEFKPITTEYWYMSVRGWPLYGRCRPCHIRKVVCDKRLRKMRSKGTSSGTSNL